MIPATRVDVQSAMIITISTLASAAPLWLRVSGFVVAGTALVVQAYQEAKREKRKEQDHE